MMKSRKKALSLALTACLATGMVWAPARTTEANDTLNQIYQQYLFARINEIQAHQQEEREKEERRRAEQEQREREAAERAAEEKERAAEASYIVPAHHLSGAEKAAFDQEHQARAAALSEASTRWYAEWQAQWKDKYLDGGYYVGWQTMSGNLYRSLSASDWQYYADGYKTHVVGYYSVSECPLLINGKMEQIEPGTGVNWDPAIVYINEQGKATVTSPGRYYYYDAQTNSSKEADTPFYVGQVLWEGLAQKQIHVGPMGELKSFKGWGNIKPEETATGLRTYTSNFHIRNSLVLVQPHLWWNVKYQGDKGFGESWAEHDIPVNFMNTNEWKDDPYVIFMVGYCGEVMGQTGLRLDKADFVQYVENPHYYNQKSY